MSRSLTVVGLTVAALSLAAAAPAPAQEPLKVNVTSAQVEKRKAVQGPEREALAAKADVARKERKDLEKQLKQQLGKKKEQWPEDKQDLLEVAREKEALANADYEYATAKLDPKGLSDSGQDIRESLAGKGMSGVKENVSIVSTPDEADLIVEVVGRRGEKTMPGQLRNDQYFVCFTIAPGPGLDAARFLEIPRDWRFKKFGYAGWKLSSPTPESNMFKFESYGDQRWSAAGQVASVMISKFIEDNAAILRKK